jgi:hypothetical protein
MTRLEDIGTVVVATLACGNMSYTPGTHTHIDVGDGLQLHRV